MTTKIQIELHTPDSPEAGPVGGSVQALDADSGMPLGPQRALTAEELELFAAGFELVSEAEDPA